MTNPDMLAEVRALSDSELEFCRERLEKMVARDAFPADAEVLNTVKGEIERRKTP